jgi:hypothetical protein
VCLEAESGALVGAKGPRYDAGAGDPYFQRTRPVLYRTKTMRKLFFLVLGLLSWLSCNMEERDSRGIKRGRH